MIFVVISVFDILLMWISCWDLCVSYLLTWISCWDWYLLLTQISCWDWCLYDLLLTWISCWDSCIWFFTHMDLLLRLVSFTHVDLLLRFMSMIFNSCGSLVEIRVYDLLLTWISCWDWCLWWQRCGRCLYHWRRTGTRSRGWSWCCNNQCRNDQNSE